MSFKCCPCCDGLAKSDHFGHGGAVHVDQHDVPCHLHDDDDLKSKIEALCKTSSGKVWATNIDIDGFVLVKDIRALLEED